VTSPFHTVNAWPPRTEAALGAAAKDGYLRETHVLEVKRELPLGEGANKELAVDLCSLAIDGGLFIVGVDEDKGHALSPVPLDGLAERIEQVARTRIDEPLPVGFIEIESASDPAEGYLLVRVEASPRAPHMVDHRYWGRGDKTKYRLSDGEVERLIALRDRWVVNAEHALHEWMAREPVSADKQRNAHLFVVADPVRAHERMLRDTFAGDYTIAFRELVSGTSHHGGQFQPDIPFSLNNFSTTTDGWAWKSYDLFGQREAGEGEREDGAVMVEICENGQLRLMCGRAASPANMPNKHLWLIDELCLGLTARMVSLADRVSQEAGYMGSWDFGVGVTGLKGAISYSRYSLNHWAGPAYPDDKYTATTRASLTEMEVSSGPVVERLLGRMMRAVGADQIDSNRKHFT
jgi:hypothetical protein